MISWVESLPNPTTTYSIAVDKAARRIEMESGRVRQNNTATVARHVFNVTWQFTDTQLKLFRAFLFWYLNQGTEFFEMNLPYGSIFRQFAVRFVDGKYTFSNNQNVYWKVTAQLEGYNI